MTVRAGWWVGLALIGSAVSSTAMADGLGLFNPLGFYVGAGIGRSSINEFQTVDFYGFNRLDDHPVGWNAFVGVRPIPFVGAELEYIDFGNASQGPGPLYTSGGDHQFMHGSVRDQAIAAFAVGYLPLPLPYLEPFVKLGAAHLRDRESTTALINNVTFSDGTPAGVSSISSTDYRTGFAYGGGLQFHFQQLAVRAQYEKITTSRYGLSYNPALLSAAVSWTF